ncbi:MAG: CNNM domain-containing protein [Arenicellales bacterium]|nr:CNNM domain-containing protein [Arenicellales bacterium]
MDAISSCTLFGSLFILLLLSAFFSASETGMMSLNRYRLRHLAKQGHRGARLAENLLKDPGRLLGTILLGNNLVNNAAAAVATVIALKYFGEVAIAFATGLITLLILIFSEIPPKTYAATYPERIAFPAAYLLTGLIRLFSPVVKVVNMAGNGLLLLFGAKMKRESDSLSSDELRTVVQEAGEKITPSEREMLLQILELSKMTVDDVMVPRAEIEAIDIEHEWDEILNQLATSLHTRVPLFRGTLDNPIGVLHMRRVLQLIHREELTPQSLEASCEAVHYIPEETRLPQQLLALKEKRHQLGLVVDEYGDVIGLITVEEILEEIVGEFTRQTPGIDEDANLQEDGSYLIRGSANVRELNRNLGVNLPLMEAKTLNGLILDTFEDIPPVGTTLLLGGFPVEVVQTQGTSVTIARLTTDPITTARGDKDES